MTESIFLLAGRKKPLRVFDDAHFSVVKSAEDISKALTSHRRTTLWIATGSTALPNLVGAPGGLRSDRRLLILGSVDPSRLALLRAVFRLVVAQDEISLLPIRELADVLRAPNRGDLFIGGAVSDEDKAVVLYRGTLEPLVVPTSWFNASSHGVEPDFSDFEIVDSGQTVRLGEFEASAEAILYELDANYRRRMKKRAAKEDRTLGGALRRLRTQRRVGRDDFGEISAKEIARIERGEVKKPHARTLAAIAKRLGVKPWDIATY